MGTRKSMKLPVILTFIMIIIVIYLFATLQQEKVVCQKTTLFDNNIKLVETVTSTIDSGKISSIHLVKKFVLPDEFLKDESYTNSIKYSLENTLDYLGKNVKYINNTNGLSVVINVSDNELLLLDNIDFTGTNDLGIVINTNTVSSDAITLSVGDKYTDGELMKKLKNNSYTCR